MAIIVFVPMPIRFIIFFSYRQQMYLWIHLSTSLFQMFTSKQSRYTYQVPEERGHSQNCIRQNQILALGCPSPRMICAECKASKLSQTQTCSSQILSPPPKYIYCRSSPSIEDSRSFFSKVKRNKSTVDGNFRFLEVSIGQLPSIVYSSG